MKKEYQKPQIEVVKLAYTGSLLQETSTTEVPGGGNGTPDAPQFFWDDEE